MPPSAWPPRIFSHASPAAPSPLANSTSPSTLLRGSSAPPGTQMPRTWPPSSTAALKTRNPQPRATSETSFSSSPKRRSGLSLP